MSTSVITAFKSLFFTYGIPEKIVSDYGPQYISQELKDFAKTYGFKHITSSPHYPQGNGQAESKVRTVKNLPKITKISISHYSAIELHLLPSAG